MKKYVYSISFLFVVLCLANCTFQTDHIKREVEKHNRQLPKMLTDALQIDSILFSRKTNTLEYYYTVLDDSIILNCDYNKTQRDMALAIKKTPAMATFRNQKMTFEYIYLSNTGKNIVLKIIIPENMYR